MTEVQEFKRRVTEAIVVIDQVKNTLDMADKAVKENNEVIIDKFDNGGELDFGEFECLNESHYLYTHTLQRYHYVVSYLDSYINDVIWSLSSEEDSTETSPLDFLAGSDFDHGSDTHLLASYNDKHIDGWLTAVKNMVANLTE